MTIVAAGRVKKTRPSGGQLTRSPFHDAYFMMEIMRELLRDPGENS